MKKTIFLMSILFLLLIGCAPRQIYPTISNYVGSYDFPKYKKIAILPFADAPGAPQSGEIVSGLASQKFAQAGFEVVERRRLLEILSEQKLSVSGLLDSSQRVQIGKLLGVAAIVDGEVGQYLTRERHTDTTYFPLFLSGQSTMIPIQGKQWTESFVSVSLRAIDVETAQVIYSGSGQYGQGLTNPPQQLAELILSSIVSKWIIGPGALGYKPQLTPEGIMVKEVFNGSPSMQAGLRAGDLITKINGKSTANITKLDLMSLSWSNPGDKVSLDVSRGDQKFSIDIVSVSREQVLAASTGVVNNVTKPQKYNAEAVAWTEKSTAMAREKNWSEMIRTASAAISIDPSYPEAYVTRSWAYLEKGFPEKAFEDCSKALSLDSNNPRALNNRGLFYLRKGVKDKAKDDFERACSSGLEVGCNNFKLVTGYKLSEKLDYCLKKSVDAFNKKDWDEVIKYTSEIQDSALALSIRAGAYAYKGMLREAMNDCDKAIKVNPDSALAYNNKGFALELMGNKQEALLNYEFACNLKLPLGCNNLKKMADAMKKP